MLIALIGPLCSGRKTITEHLIKEYGFQHIVLDNEKETYHENTGSNASLHFNSSSELLLFVTKRWTINYVTTDLRNPIILEEFRKRPFVLLVAVDAPTFTRFNRFRSLHETNLEEFIIESDKNIYGVDNNDNQNPNNNINFSQGGLYKILSTADLHIYNGYDKHELLYDHIHSLQITSLDRLRPSWDTYFMSLANLAARRSNCMKRRVGCILVRDKRILATGYNGTPKGLLNCNLGGCTRCNGAIGSGNALEECLCMHAEENALLEAGRERVGDDRTLTTLYCNTCPCLRCATKIVQIGVKEVVYSMSYSMDAESAKVLQKAGVLLRQHYIL